MTFDVKLNRYDWCLVVTVGTLNVSETERREWGTMFGDCIHNLRSALDHLAWYMVSVGSKAGALNDQQAHKVQFPIDTVGDDQKFADRLENWLPGVNPMLRAISRRYQPYISGNQMLGALADLTNEDKHRVIIPLLLRNERALLEVTDLENCQIARWHIPTGADRVQEGTVMALIYIRPSGSREPHGKVNVRYAGSVALESGLWMNEFLGQASRLVESILDEFQRVLQAL